jgi:hypothetical protein
VTHTELCGSSSSSGARHSRTFVLDWKADVSMRDRMLLFLAASARNAFWPSCNRRDSKEFNSCLAIQDPVLPPLRSCSHHQRFGQHFATSKFCECAPAAGR